MPRPARNSNSELKRVQMDLPPKSLLRLKRLQEITEAGSYAEVIRNALRLYEAIVEEQENGAEIFVKRDDVTQPLMLLSA